MSRHRDVRNLDVNGQHRAHLKANQTRAQPIPAGPSAELEAYDGYSDSQEEEMTEEQHGTLCRPPYELLPLLIVL